MARYYIYVLYSLKDNKFYTGFTEDLLSRIKQHTRGEVRSTKDRLPLLLIHYEYFIDEKDAKAREVFLKSGFGRDQLRKSLQRTLTKLGTSNQ